MDVGACWHDDEKQLVFGTLDNQPINDYQGKIELGSELAVTTHGFESTRSRIEFTKQ